ncbi:hypothetical protein FG147_10250, partial [Thauera sp. UPWRP]
TAFRLPTSSAATHGCTRHSACKRRRAPSRRSRSCARPPAGSGDSRGALRHRMTVCLCFVAAQSCGRVLRALVATYSLPGGGPC